MLRRLFSEPLFHFTVAGFVIFGLFALTDDTPDLPSENEIVVSVSDASRLSEQYEATWRRPPSPQELDALIDEFINEEILVREALALGLDQNDTIVRRRLRQKMEFLSEAPAASATPDEEALVEFLRENEDRFARAARVGFEQILLEDYGANAEAALTALASGGDPAAFAARTLLPYAVSPSTATSIDGAFGSGFFDRVASLPSGGWQGPVASSFGSHLVKVTVFEPSKVPELGDVRERVEQEWRASEAMAQRARFLEFLAQSYAVSRPDPREVLE